MKNLFLLLILLMPFRVLAQITDNIHLFMVVDKQSADIREGMTSASRFYESLFSKVKTYNIKKYSFEIDQSKYLKESLQNLEVAPNDVIVFISLVHGFRKNGQTDFYPYLKMDTDYHLKEIEGKLLAKNAQFTLLINESCNAVANENIAIPKVEEKIAFDRYVTAIGVGVMTKFEALLRKSKGNFSILASSPNEVAFIAPEGGVFSQAVAKNMDCVLSQELSPEKKWQELGISISGQTALDVQKAIVNRDISQDDINDGFDKQNPIFFGQINGFQVDNKQQNNQKTYPQIRQVKTQLLLKYAGKNSMVLFQTASGMKLNQGKLDYYFKSKNYSDLHYLITEDKEKNIIIVSEVSEKQAIQNPCISK